MHDKYFKSFDEIEKLLPANWKKYCEAHAHIAAVRNQLLSDFKELSIAEKVGKFDDYFENESPKLNEAISANIKKIRKLIHAEIAKERKRETFAVDTSPYGHKSEEQNLIHFKQQGPNNDDVEVVKEIVEQKIEFILNKFDFLVDNITPIKIIVGLAMLCVIQFIWHLYTVDKFSTNSLIQSKLFESKLSAEQETNNQLNAEINSLKLKVTVIEAQLIAAQSEKAYGQAVQQRYQRYTNKRNPSSVTSPKSVKRRR